MQAGAGFAGAGTTVLFLGFHGGGSDPVVFQQLGLLLWGMLALALAFGVLPRIAPRRELRVPLVAGLILVVLSGLSLFWSPGVDGTLEVMNRLSLYVAALIVVLAAANSRTWQAWALGVALATIGIVFAGVLDRLFPAFFELDHPSGAAASRLAAPLAYWNAMAGLAVAAVLASVAGGCLARSRFQRGIALAAMPTALLGLHLTFSRGGLLALVIGLAVLAALAHDRRALLRRGGAALVLGLLPVAAAHTEPEILYGSGGAGGPLIALVLAIVSAGAFAVGYERASVAATPRRGPTARVVFVLALAAATAVTAWAAARETPAGPVERGTGMSSPSDPAERLISTESRRGEIWGSAVRAGAESGLFGQGAGSFRVWWAADNGEPLVNDAHSFYLQLFAELGLPGLAAALTGIGTLLALALRARRTLKGRQALGAHSALLAVLAALAAQAAVDWTFEVPAVAIVAFACLGLAGAADSRPRPTRRHLSRSRALAIAACLLLAVVQVPGLVSLERVRSSYSALAAGAPEVALERSREAADAAPWSAPAAAAEAEAELALGMAPAALEDARRALDAAQEDWSYAVLLARVAEAAGARREAIAALRTAAELRPGAAALYEAARRSLRAGRGLPKEVYSPRPRD